MIRGLSPIPRGGGIPEGKEGVCITTLGALRTIKWARDRFRGTREGERMPRYTGVRVPFYIYYILCSRQS